MILDEVKLVLGITDNEKDALLNVYIRRAVFSIKNYLNNERFNDADIERNYPEAVVALVENIHTLSAQSSKGVKTKRQGDRSITYADDSSITVGDDIKALLPTPYVRMM